MDQDTKCIRAYHERSKHHFDRYARGPRTMDWENQPDPFRTFEGAERVELPLQADRIPTSFSTVRSGESVPPEPVSRETLSALLEVSLGLSAWKGYGGNRWALRCNPSSGNLHPTECYVLTPSLPGLSGGLYHYLSRDHVLEFRACPNPREWDAAAFSGGLVVGLTSVPWREAWKYGERAYRYCQHDLGHALAALRYATAALGWNLRILTDVGDGQIAALLGLDRMGDFTAGELESPEALLWAGPGDCPAVALSRLAGSLERGAWSGRANVLSAHREVWEAIEEVGIASRRPAGAEDGPAEPLDPLPPLSSGPQSLRAVDLIRQRRSAVAFDGKSHLPKERFFALLDAVLPRPGAPPLDVIGWPPLLHLLLFVHRVDGVEPGIYLLPRSRRGEFLLKEALGDRWVWQGVPSCPTHIPLSCLAREDVTLAARIVSCHQEIAADSALSLGMLAEFDSALDCGAWWYRRLFWEAGAIGQLLYLEAEAAGFRGTGIGCFFDDEVLRLLDLEGRGLQSLYHFTVGKPVEDARLSILPPYAHLGDR